VVIQSWDFNSDPGWTTTGEWAFGVPTGAVGRSTATLTHERAHGSNVYGVNLAGDYGLTRRDRTSDVGADDCSGYANVELKFWRWLNSDFQPYVYATVEVSSDGTSWTTVWRTRMAKPAMGVDAVQVRHRAVADNQPPSTCGGLRDRPRIRSVAWPYSGWNIDDVQLVSVPPENRRTGVPRHWADAFHEGMKSTRRSTRSWRGAAANYNAIFAEVLAYHDDLGDGHGAYWNSSLVPRATDIVGDFDRWRISSSARGPRDSGHCWLVAFRSR